MLGVAAVGLKRLVLLEHPAVLVSVVLAGLALLLLM
jgi:hypothetical protein